MMGFIDASELTGKAQAAFLHGLGLPAALGLVCQDIETPGDIIRRRLRLFAVFQNIWAESAGDGGLLDDKTRIAAV